MSPEIIKLSEATRLLAEVRNAGDAGDLSVTERKMHLGRDAGDYSREIQYRAMAKLGRLLQGIPKAKGALLRGTRQAPRDSTPTLADLGITKKESSRCQFVARIAVEDPALFDRVATGRIPFTQAKEQIKRNRNAELAAQIRREPPPPPTGPFSVIAIDPPWKYDNRDEDITHRSWTYPCMTPAEITALPVPTLAGDDCVLWLWATNAHMRQAYECLDAWGFEPKTILTWSKDRMGYGNWLRGKTEHCILAVKGHPLVTLTNQTTLLNGHVREHSRKPAEFYQLVESLCPGSRLEMFSRESREGWVQWGAEPDRFITTAA